MPTDSFAVAAYTFVVMLLVPGIISGMFLYGIKIAICAWSGLKRSAWSGFAAGLVTFVIVVVTQLNSLQEPVSSFSALPAFDLSTILPPIFIGCVGGFILLWIIESTIETRLIGAMTLILSCGSSISLFFYIFDTNIRETAILLALSTILGLLLYRTFMQKRGTSNSDQGRPKNPQFTQQSNTQYPRYYQGQYPNPQYPPYRY